MDCAKARQATKLVVGLLVVFSLTVLLGRSAQTQYYGLGDIPLDAATYQKHLKLQPKNLAEAVDQVLPSMYDARTEGIVTSARNQGSCGSCWAFASVGGIESHILEAYGGDDATLDLSEQQQVSCNTAMWGCSGGNSSAPRYWEDQGPLNESDYPYTASDSPCTQDLSKQLGFRVIDWHTVSPTTENFKNSLYTYGPSYWRYTVYSDFDTYWAQGNKGDVYVSQAGATYRGGHAVLLIGWDDTKGAFLCKNSWGGGGPNGDGTFWIAYDGHYNDLGFGMSNFSLTSLTCGSDGECDDGIYCNGAETCVGGACQDGTPPVCADDGLFCNGTEVCDELNQGCGSTGDPCGAGTVCDEDSDTCELPNCGDGICDAGENCSTCSADCISGSSGGTDCGACFKGICNGVCHPKEVGTNCPDCAASWCCGDGVCEGDEDGFNCAIDCGAPPVCGNGFCDLDAGESACNCAEDCGPAPSSEAGSCGDGVDNDCDGLADCADNDCGTDPVCTSCLPKGDPCAANDDCCSGQCHPTKNTCK